METPPESDTTAVNFNDTELTLWLPGGPRPPTVIGRYTGVKRGHSETIDLNLGSSNILPRGKVCPSGNESESEVSSTRKPPAAKAQVVGWPPLRSCRKKALESCKYVKVAVDGAPYLRKVDLEAYRSYEELLRALEEMFTCFTIRCNPVDESKLMDMVKGIEYVPTYEDNDGDWMLVGDVPWKMFKESCKRIRLMKSSESLEIAQEIPSKCKGTE